MFSKMNYIISFILYFISFIVLYNIFSFLNIDEKVFFFLTPTVNTNPTINESDKPENILKAEGSSKPLKLTKPEIGRHTWALLHSMANTYPENPTEEEKEIMKKFFYGLAKSYPCKVCGGHLYKLLNKKGLKLDSRKEFIQNICEIHNIVNKVLNKTQFDCNKAFEVWNGNYSCDIYK